MEQNVIKDIQRELSEKNPNTHWVKLSEEFLKSFNFKDWVKTGLIEKPARAKKILGKKIIFQPLCEHVVRYAGGYIVQVLRNSKYKYVWDNNGDIYTKDSLAKIEEHIWEREYRFTEYNWAKHKKEWSEFLKRHEIKGNDNE
ncbi:MAG: hypothetical protein Unbinned1524contig1000_2 [Prokaryotic dsDNA virus sp.]|nr:MAG: hypothetical protein Unbinned1524contig1000_2 [Prokaryotic dsDNA virus sp.]|tara:strand:- start:4353 stop:4778 length:426 start_codon:yes stop_codon:yes gene_type:complete